MFIRIKKINNYLKEQHLKELQEQEKEHNKYVRKLQKQHEEKIKELKSFHNSQIKKKNREINLLKEQREKYIDKSLEYNINMERIERLHNYIEDEFSFVVKECKEILQSDLNNFRFVCKNEHRWRSK